MIPAVYLCDESSADDDIWLVPLARIVGFQQMKGEEEQYDFYDVHVRGLPEALAISAKQFDMLVQFFEVLNPRPAREPIDR